MKFAVYLNHRREPSLFEVFNLCLFIILLFSLTTHTHLIPSSFCSSSSASAAHLSYLIVFSSFPRSLAAHIPVCKRYQNSVKD